VEECLGMGVRVGMAASVLGASLALAQDAPPRLRGALDQVNDNSRSRRETERRRTSETTRLSGSRQ